MKRMTILILVCILACLFAFGMPNYSGAIETDMYRYDITNGEARITGYLGKGSEPLQEPLRVPDKIDGHEVTRIDTSAFANKPNLIEVILPKGLRSLGDYAFSNCANLENITLPDGLLEIGDYAFARCLKLEKVLIPDSVNSVGNWAFANCSNLKWLKIGNDMLSNQTQTVIGLYAFSQCSDLAYMDLGKTVSRIEKYAFLDCGSLNALILREGMTSIADYAFAGCSGLKAVGIPESIVRIGENAFLDCTELSSVFFYGDAPEGTANAFADRSRKLTFFYRDGMDGFRPPIARIRTMQFRSAPAPAIMTNPREASRHDVIVRIGYPADTLTREYKVGKDGQLEEVPWISYDGPFSLSANATVCAKFTNMIGVMSEIRVVHVTNIDKAPPSIAMFMMDGDVDGSPVHIGDTVTGRVRVETSDESRLVRKVQRDGRSIAWPDNNVFSKSGNYSGTVRDAANNSSTFKFTIR